MVGGGTIGAWCAWFLRREGLDVVLVEANTLGKGASSRAAGMVRAQGGTEIAVRLGIYAREFYSRRNESVRLWVVARTEITDLADPDLLQPPLDRSFKKPGGYVMRDKLEVAKRRAAQEATE